MSSRSLTPALVLAIALATGVDASGQGRPAGPAGATMPHAETAVAVTAWIPPKTPWGDPDLQGIYTSDDYMDTPLERPAAFGERRYFTEEELDEAAAKLARQTEAALQGTLQRTQRLGYSVGDARVGWGERPRRPARQTSLIVDPPNGKLPPLTPEGRRRQSQIKQTAISPQTPPASWKDFDFYIRCISRGVAGSILPSSYDNGTQILQAPGFVTILHEKIHEARIIPLDERPHVGTGIRGYLGDSRGHFEGNTLVVETTNFLDDTTSIGRNGGNAVSTSDALRLIERFTRVDADTMNYELTVDDPKIFSAPWKVAFPITQESGYELFEYTCHETNYSMTNILSGTRAQEKAGAAKQK
jgi:hypothetical protein